jgi:hypothetical protein
LNSLTRIGAAVAVDDSSTATTKPRDPRFRME